MMGHKMKFKPRNMGKTYGQMGEDQKKKTKEIPQSKNKQNKTKEEK